MRLELAQKCRLNIAARATHRLGKNHDFSVGSTSIRDETLRKGTLARNILLQLHDKLTTANGSATAISMDCWSARHSKSLLSYGAMMSKAINSNWEWNSFGRLERMLT